MTNKRTGRKQRRPIWGDPTNRVGRQATAQRHGINVLEVEAMRKKQDDMCAICQTKLGDKAVIDHDHELARQHGHPENRGCRLCVRALLCSRCNNLLGMAQDSPAILMRAMAYIKIARQISGGAVHVKKVD